MFNRGTYLSLLVVAIMAFAAALVFVGIADARTSQSRRDCMSDRTKARYLNPEMCMDDAVTELFQDVCPTTEQEDIEEIERTGKIEIGEL